MHSLLHRIRTEAIHLMDGCLRRAEGLVTRCREEEENVSRIWKMIRKEHHGSYECLLSFHLWTAVRILRTLDIERSVANLVEYLHPDRLEDLSYALPLRQQADLRAYLASLTRAGRSYLSDAHDYGRVLLL